jgi:VanZ family protein
MGTQSLRARILRYGPLLLWMAFIWFASTSEFSAANSSRIIRPLLLWLFPHLSEARLDVIHVSIRKASHFSEYAVLGLLAARAFSTSFHESLRRTWFFSGLLLVTIYALADEYHQSFVPSRTPSLYDSMIDVAGGVIALILFALWRRKRAQAHREAVAARPSRRSVQDED